MQDKGGENNEKILVQACGMLVTYSRDSDLVTTRVVAMYTSCTQCKVSFTCCLIRIFVIVQWQYAPNNNGRAKKTRLKKEAAAAAQPQFFKPPDSQPSVLQQHPAQPVSTILHADTDRYLLDRLQDNAIKPAIVSVDPSRALPHTQPHHPDVHEQANEQAPAASGTHLQAVNAAQHGAQPDVSGPCRQQLVTDVPYTDALQTDRRTTDRQTDALQTDALQTDALQTDAQHIDALHAGPQQPPVAPGQVAVRAQSEPRDALQQHFEVEATAAAGSRTERQGSPAFTEHRHMLHQALTDPFVISPGAHDSGKANQHIPETIAVCQNSSPDHAGHSAKDGVPVPKHRSALNTPAQQEGHLLRSSPNAPVADQQHSPTLPGNANDVTPAQAAHPHSVADAPSQQTGHVQDRTAALRSTAADSNLSEASHNRSPAAESIPGLGGSEADRGSPAKALALAMPLASATNSNWSSGAERAVLKSAQPELEQFDRSQLHQQRPIHAAEAPVKPVFQHHSAEDAVNISSMASNRCSTIEQGHALSNVDAEPMPNSNSSVGQATWPGGQAEHAPKVDSRLNASADPPQWTDVDRIVMPPPPSRDHVAS